jgi:cell division septation protein DedD
MEKKDYSDTGQRSDSDELFEEIFRLARKSDQKARKAVGSEIKVTQQHREGTKKVSSPRRKQVVEAPPLKRRTGTPTGKETRERKTPLRQPRSKRVSKLLILLLLLAAAAAAASFLLPSSDLMSFFNRSQEPPAVRKQVPKRSTPKITAGLPEKRPLQTARTLPQVPPPQKHEAGSAAQTATGAFPPVEAVKRSEQDNGSLKKTEPGSLPSIEMTKEAGKDAMKEAQTQAATIPPAGGKGERTSQESKSERNASSPIPEEAKSYPYSVYLGSFKKEDAVRKALALYRKRGLSPYLVRMDLGAKGVWLRVYDGHFETREKADIFVKKNRIPDAKTNHTRYAVLIGVYSSLAEAQARMRSLSQAGCHPYIIGEKAPHIRVYTGAFYREEDAKKELAWLGSKGIKGKVVER